MAVFCVLVAGVVVSDVPVEASSDAGSSSTRTAASELELGLGEGARVVVEEARLLGSVVVVASEVDSDIDVEGALVAARTIIDAPNDVLVCARTDVDAGFCVEVTGVDIEWSGI
mmetsp:Transcript_84341/g.272665  ORF Transcript_84341/g.272665 Transcript_84341/m.272665 type:complete len:114 (-) Transcript_84341:683-1024(-)